MNDVFNIFVENFSAIIREYLYKYCSPPDVTIRDMVCSVASTSENINECLEADSRDFGLDYFDDFDRQINQITTEDDEKTNNVDFGQADVEVIAEISENLEKYIEKHHVNQITKAEIQNFVDNIARLGGRLEILGCAKLGNLFMSLSATVSKYSEAFEKNFPSLIFLFEAMRVSASCCASFESGTYTAIWSPSKSALNAAHTSG